jgi:hypothetical protein
MSAPPRVQNGAGQATPGRTIIRAMLRVALAPLALVILAGCTENASETSSPVACDPGLERFRGACVDPARRYEPGKSIDQGNVAAYGDPLTELKLPPPPKSGFRIIAPPRIMLPGEEADFCLSWPFPTITNHVIYAGRLYTTPGLHHSNVITKAVDPKLGPNPYPSCHPGASDPFSQVPGVIPDVLFANSTQVTGEETLAFPPGLGFRVDPAREITTNIHFLNTSAEPLRVEVAYDFFTMSDADLTTLVAPFFMQVNDFLIPPHTQGTVGTACDVYGGKVVSLMPHTHNLSQRFTVDLLKEGGEERVLENGPFDAKSHIAIYDPPIDLTAVQQMRFECLFNNTTDHDVVYGIGENEMCILFGYVYPPIDQFVGYADYQGKPCTSIQLGFFQ